MTIKELRKEFKRMLNKLSLWGLEEMADYYTAEWATFEELYREGTVKRFSNDFLGNANHYQFYMIDYKNLSILQTLDLHSISATKKVTRDMMAMFLNVDGWVCGYNSKYEKKPTESVEVAEETAAPEAEQTAETAEQKTELDTEVEAEQTENNAESISETHDSKDVKTDISKTGKLSVTTKTLVTFSFVVSEYLKQIGYIDTS